MRRRSVLAYGSIGLVLIAPQLQGQITYPVNFRAGVFAGGTKRNVSLDNSVTGRLDASLKGFEAMISPAREAVGIGGRVMDGSFGGQKFSLKEGRIFVGESWFHVEAAYGERSVYGTDSTAVFSKAGLRSIVQIGGSGFSLSASGSKYFQGDFSKKNAGSDDKPAGWEGETSLFYTAPKFPVFVQLGYRTEYFSFGKREEHQSGIIFGAGLWLGGR